MFLFVGVLFFRLIADPSINNSNETTIGNGLAQLQTNRGGRACLFILGFFLIVYGTFAVSRYELILMYLLMLSSMQDACISHSHAGCKHVWIFLAGLTQCCLNERVAMILSHTC